MLEIVQVVFFVVLIATILASVASFKVFGPDRFSDIEKTLIGMIIGMLPATLIFFIYKWIYSILEK